MGVWEISQMPRFFGDFPILTFLINAFIPSFIAVSLFFSHTIKEKGIKASYGKIDF